MGSSASPSCTERTNRSCGFGSRYQTPTLTFSKNLGENGRFAMTGSGFQLSEYYVMTSRPMARCRPRRCHGLWEDQIKSRVYATTPWFRCRWIHAERDHSLRPDDSFLIKQIRGFISGQSAKQKKRISDESFGSPHRYSFICRRKVWCSDHDFQFPSSSSSPSSSESSSSSCFLRILNHQPPLTTTTTNPVFTWHSE